MDRTTADTMEMQTPSPEDDGYMSYDPAGTSADTAQTLAQPFDVDEDGYLRPTGTTVGTAGMQTPSPEDDGYMPWPTDSRWKSTK